jgi:hypothetical protein
LGDRPAVQANTAVGKDWSIDQSALSDEAKACIHSIMYNQQAMLVPE